MYIAAKKLVKAETHIKLRLTPTSLILQLKKRCKKCKDHINSRYFNANNWSLLEILRPNPVSHIVINRKTPTRGVTRPSTPPTFHRNRFLFPAYGNMEMQLVAITKLSHLLVSAISTSRTKLFLVWNIGTIICEPLEDVRRLFQKREYSFDEEFTQFPRSEWKWSRKFPACLTRVGSRICSVNTCSRH